MIDVSKNTMICELLGATSVPASSIEAKQSETFKLVGHRFNRVGDCPLVFGMQPSCVSYTVRPSFDDKSVIATINVDYDLSYAEVCAVLPLLSWSRCARDTYLFETGTLEIHNFESGCYLLWQG
jgi:hypothetical protein